MLRVSLGFPTGRFHATPWGRHVNEGVPEWPPAPWRLLRALVDVWQRKSSRLDDTRVEPILQALASEPPVFLLPPARASHTRSYLHQNKPNPTDKKLVFDPFVVLDPGARVEIGWEGVELTTAQRADLEILLSRLQFLGRSESWVEARVQPTGEPEPAWNCKPVSTGEPLRGAEIAPVMCMEQVGAYRQHPWVTGKGRKAAPVSWLDALCWPTDQFLSEGMSQPPGQQRVLYWRSAEALDAPTQARLQPGRRAVGSVIYQFNGPTLPRVIETLEIAAQARRRLMGIQRRQLGHDEISGCFSGKRADGAPLEGHRHLRYLPQDLDGDGHIDHLLVWGPTPLEDHEIAALAALRSLYLRGRAELQCTVASWGMGDSLRGQATTVVSLTPFLPTRHRKPKRDGPLHGWLERELLRELSHHGLPKPVEIRHLEYAEVTGRRVAWREFRRNRKGEAPRRGYGFELVFPAPIPAPFTLGYGAHFGLGMFGEGT